jgi:hypothetical protein
MVLEGAAQIIEDRGGEEFASLLLQRAAHRVMHLDGLLSADELKLAQSQEIDRILYLNTAEVWLRYARAIGIERSAKRVPRIAEYLAARAAESKAPQLPASDQSTPAATASPEGSAAPIASNAANGEGAP